jgi:hypothetical protein
VRPRLVFAIAAREEEIGRIVMIPKLPPNPAVKKT